MKLTFKRILAISILCNVILLIPAIHSAYYAQTRSCTELRNMYMSRYKSLEESAKFWDYDTFTKGEYTDEERDILFQFNTVETRASIIEALCEAPLTEQTPFDSVPTITEVPTEGSKESSTSAESTQ